VGRFWSLLFLAVPVVGCLTIFAGMADETWPILGHWLPEDVSANGAVIDGLYNFILVLTGVIFIITGVILFYFLWKFDGARNTEPVVFVHGSHTLEVVWSIIPAATLLFIAIYQLDAWAGAKMRRPMDPGPDQVVGTADDTPVAPLAEVLGRQFEWRIRYPGKDGKLYTRDDLLTVNDLHVPIDEPVVLRLNSADVLHSFFVPNMRVKQDLVPGMSQLLWFEATKAGTYDIVCAELCGWGHYKMKGRVTVESRADYEKYLASLEAELNATEYTPSVKDSEDE